MILRILFAALAGLVAGLFEVAVTPFLPAWADIRPLIPLVAVLIVSSSRSRAYAAMVGGALAIEAYAVWIPDAPLFRLVLVVMLMDVAARQFLTNRSVYATAALAVLGLLASWILSLLISGAAIGIGLADGPWSAAAFPFFAMVWGVLLASGAFLAVAAFTARFRL
ncbi:MAG TPA: hypothetical protein VMU11_03095 [Verrucomicrobiae bacterium]|nr:hypothetical protein [Verrucomicrobiae bacterium]